MLEAHCDLRLEASASWTPRGLPASGWSTRSFCCPRTRRRAAVGGSTSAYKRTHASRVPRRAPQRGAAQLMHAMSQRLEHSVASAAGRLDSPYPWISSLSRCRRAPHLAARHTSSILLALGRRPRRRSGAVVGAHLHLNRICLTASRVLHLKNETARVRAPTFTPKPTGHRWLCRQRVESLDRRRSGVLAILTGTVTWAKSPSSSIAKLPRARRGSRAPAVSWR